MHVAVHIGTIMLVNEPWLTIATDQLKCTPVCASRFVLSFRRGDAAFRLAETKEKNQKKREERQSRARRADSTGTIWCRWKWTKKEEKRRSGRGEGVEIQSRRKSGKVNEVNEDGGRQNER